MRTFKVSDVEPIVEAPLTAVDLPTSLEYRVQSGVEAAGSNQHSFVQCRLHPLIEAAHLAFDLHLPLTFSPDDVWTCIAQGFGIHVDLHAEELRRRLVAHTGKIVIGVRRDDFLRGASANDWAGVVNEISGQMNDAIEFVELGEMEGDEATIDEGVSALAALAARADADKVQALLAGEADSNDTFLEIHAGAGGIQLQIERRRLDELLLVAGQAREAVREGVGDAEFHQRNLSLGHWPETNGNLRKVFRPFLDI